MRFLLYSPQKKKVVERESGHGSSGYCSKRAVKGVLDGGSIPPRSTGAVRTVWMYVIEGKPKELTGGAYAEILLEFH